MATVPIFAPDGTLGDIPADQLMAAVKAGAKPGVHITAPDGSAGVVPADRTADAVKAGAKLVPIDDQPVQHPGFWASMGSDLKGLLHPSGFNPYPGMGQEEKAAAAGQSFEQDQERQKAGYTAPYRVLAPVAQSAGVNVPGMEQSAKEGDIAGVAGHATAPAVALGAAEALHHTGGPVRDAAVEAGAPILEKAKGAIKNVTPKQAAQTVGAATGAGLGHGALSVPGAYYGAKGAGSMIESVLGKERANAPLITKPEPPTFPGAPLPEHPGTFPGAPLPETPAPELLQAQPLAQGGAAPPPEPAAVLAQLPVRAVHQAIQELGPRAPIADVTARAAQISKLSDLLNQGLGGKSLEPNVPLKNQGGVVTPPGSAGSMATSVAEGHTPVESSALKSYKYDPTTREFESVTNTGAHYIHGDVSPEQAAAFESAASKGKAWNELRKNSTRVAKVVNGKRVPVRPVLSEEDAIPEDEWKAGHELETQVEGSQR